MREQLQRLRMYREIIARPWHAAVLVVLVLLFLHIELTTAAVHAPESVLVRVLTPEGSPEQNAECYGDVLVDGQAVQQKAPLTKLTSLYEVVDPAAFYASNDTGFYQLSTGLMGHEEAYEVRIVCYSPEFEGVSYTIVNEENEGACTVATNGALVIC